MKTKTQKHLNTDELTSLSGINLASYDLTCLFVDFIDLSGCQFVSRDLTLLKGQDSYGDNITFAGALLAIADFRHAKYKRVNFTNCQFVNARFGRALLVKADFTGATLDKSNLDNIQAPNNIFKDIVAEGLSGEFAQLSGSNFSGAKIKDSKLFSSVLNNIDFSGAVLVDVDFSHSEMRNCNFEGATLTRVDLSNTDLEGSNLEGVDLSTCTTTISDTWWGVPHYDGDIIYN
ncbi:pentapeptide repeat-containing protein [Psychrobacter sp. AOP31-A1-22]|uniref:pentapeptide repeat-containing protein n=1 Tax=Psychrobacter sp. AOP31-A1-22 TaxID=3457696 RepID=UPI004035B68D